MAKDEHSIDTCDIFGCRNIDIHNFKRFNGGCHSQLASLGKVLPLESFSREIQLETLEAYKTLLSSRKFTDKAQEYKDRIKQIEAML